MTGIAHAFTPDRRRLTRTVPIVLCALLCAFAVIRTMPVRAATVTWDGGGADGNWTTPQNWSSNQAPDPGDALVFPAGATRLANTNDFPAGTSFAGVAVQGGGYNLQGNAIAIGAGGISHTGTGVSRLSMPVRFAANQTVSVADINGSIELDDAAEIPAGVTVTFAGEGTRALDGAVSGSGAIAVQGGRGLRLTGNGAAFTGPITVQNGGLLVYGQFGASPVTITNGRIFGTGTVKSLTVSGNSDSDPGQVLVGSTGVLRVNEALSFGGRMDFDITQDGSTHQYDQIVADRTTLTNAVLNIRTAAGYNPPAGLAFILIDNRGSAPVTGQFSGLPEGAGVRVGSGRGSITYAGGDGNDVVVRTGRASLPTMSCFGGDVPVGDSVLCSVTATSDLPMGGTMVHTITGPTGAFVSIGCGVTDETVLQCLPFNSTGVRCIAAAGCPVASEPGGHFFSFFIRSSMPGALTQQIAVTPPGGGTPVAFEVNESTAVTWVAPSPTPTPTPSPTPTPMPTPSPTPTPTPTPSPSPSPTPAPTPTPCPPGACMAITGTAIRNGAPVPGGTQIRALHGTTVCGTALTTGNSFVLTVTPGSITPGCPLGVATLTLTVDGVTAIAGPQVKFAAGTTMSTTLTVGSSPAPAPAATPTPKPAPSPTPAPTPVPGLQPMTVNATVTVPGGPPPPGMIVRAFVGSTPCGQSATSAGGALTLSVLSASQLAGCGTPGAIVTFRAGAAPAQPAVPFTSAGAITVQLKASTPP